MYDPSLEADATRGTVSDELVEGIDLAATFQDYFGAEAIPHRLEGSLLPLIHGTTPSDWREFAFSEYDYSPTPARTALGQKPSECRLIMAVNKRWKYVYAENFQPMLFDLENDPHELSDLGTHADYAGEREMLDEVVFAWSRSQSQRITTTDQHINGMSGGAERASILIGYWDEKELEAGQE